MKKVIFVFILFAINYFNAQVNTLESSLVLQNGLYYQNNAPFTGNALSYYPQEQIKSICEIKEGQKTGRFTSFYHDKNFQKSNYKDTALLRTIENQILKTKIGIKSVITDTVSSYLKMTTYLKEEIGGEKKLIKMEEKNKEGDLKEKKSEELRQYKSLCYYHQLAIERLNEQELKLKTTKGELEKELSKKEFFGISKEQYQQKNGIKDGSFISHFENGKISSEGIYKDGKYNDSWSFYYENGNPKGKGRYQMGDGTDLSSTGLSCNGRDGQWFVFFENGKLEQECNYFDGKLDGSFKSYFTSGKTNSEGVFKDGNYNDLWTFYHENGNLKGKGNFKMGNGTDLGSTGISRNGRDGKWELYHENGKISQECSYVDGKLKGVFKSYYVNGNMELEYNFLDEKYDGKYISWFENGNLKKEGFYNNGKSFGLFKYYYESGVLKSEENWKDTLREGIYKDYYENGKLKQDGIYKEGKANGVYKWYHDNGKLKQEGTFINGKFFGLLKIYYPTGVLSSEENWKDDLKEGLCKYYYENGKLKQETNYLKDKKNGNNKLFFENGKLSGEGKYINDKKNGVFTVFKESGVLKNEITFVNDKPHGNFKSFFENGKLEMNAGMDSTSLADASLYGECRLYNEDGSLKNYFFMNRDGTYIDKMPITKNTTSSTSNVLNEKRFNEPFSCECCGNEVKGIRYAWGRDCGNAKDDLQNPDLYNYFNKSLLSFGYYYIYCSPRCVKSCSSGSFQLGSPCSN